MKTRSKGFNSNSRVIMVTMMYIEDVGNFWKAQQGQKITNVQHMTISKKDQQDSVKKHMKADSENPLTFIATTRTSRYPPATPTLTP